jgi:hypothetical protein
MVNRVLDGGQSIAASIRIVRALLLARLAVGVRTNHANGWSQVS